MDLGFRLPHYGPAASPETILAAARIAEEDGWHSLWTSDHVAIPVDRPGDLAFLSSYERIYESLITLAFVASATDRIKLGTSAIVLPQRQVMLAAKQMASIDSLSKGRLILGLAAGWAEVQFQLLGAGSQFRRRGKALDEGIRAMRTLWTDDQAAFHGEGIDFPAVDFWPKPAQRGDLPIWIAGNSEAAQRRAARMADGWNPTALGAAETAAGMASIRQWRAEAGRRGPFTFSGSLRFTGTVDETLATLAPYADIGLDLMICGFTDPDPDTLLARLRVFGREILPAFRS